MHFIRLDLIVKSGAGFRQKTSNSTPANKLLVCRLDEIGLESSK